MATANKTFQARLQLKTDSETNWNTAAENGFVPLAGELIVYKEDATHHYCRLKIGNGRDDVGTLNFIDAGTLNGIDVEIVRAYGRFNFPQQGSTNKLYLDLLTTQLFYYTPSQGYIQIADFSISTTTTNVSNILSWDAGNMFTAQISLVR